ncbi:hybrid sensor histidine kinase/response regulator [Candidatus Entotheonella palauensis]|uniref:hybrid sensor histidine kinase/response regulator n=1 Tax=Candidatus Entotheonella palauensis TaxID=93172 RepID=UPI000B7E9370|nr:response regulator [Candidatus Entotheonella palauensis]
MRKPLKVIIVDDNEDDAILLVRALRRGGFEPAYRCIDNATALRQTLIEAPWELVICDHVMPQFDSLTALKIVEEAGLDLPFIVVSGTMGEELAVTTMKAGAHDYIMKDNLLRLVPAVERELGEAQERRLRRQAEQALRLTQFTVDRSADAAFWISQDARLFYVNEAACRSLGYTRNELLTMRVHDIDPGFPPAVWQAHWQQLRQQGSRTFESQHRARCGDVFPVEITVNYLTYEGQEYHCVFARDITERKSLEAQLRQAQKMEAIGTLAGGIAHDFNNILAAIMGFTELTQLMVRQESTVWQNLQQVQIASQRAKALVQQILAFSRQHSHERNPVPFHTIVQEVLRLLQASLPTTIVIDYQGIEQADVVLADSTQLHQVLMNICTNAEYAMREMGGTLELRLHTADIDIPLVTRRATLPPGAYVRLSIRDTGCGMGADVLERIFEPFYTTKPQSDGTGMGLAVVHGIMAEHHGAVTVESIVGKGSTFTLYLPRLTEFDSIYAGAGDTIVQGQARILFVDDEPSIVQTTPILLQHFGYEVTSNTRSREAIERFRSNPEYFDLVITDQTMPEITGKELASALRRIRPDIPIILCTGFSHMVSAESAQALGIDAFCLKPVTAQELAQTIQKILAQRAS